MKAMTIGEALKKLESIKDREDYKVSFAFGDARPTYFESYRGSYDEIALGYTGDYSSYPTAKNFYEDLKDCLERDFYGWKGGEYTMHGNTPIHVACEGVATSTVLSDIKIRPYESLEGGWVTLLTCEVED